MCFSDRKTPVCCVMILSALAMICGIIMIAFAFMFTNMDVVKEMEKEYKEIEDGRKMVFIGLVIFSLLTMLVAGLGFCTKCCKNFCFNLTYGLILTPVWIIVIVIGAASLYVSTAANEKIEEECLKLVEELNTKLAENGIGLDLGDVDSEAAAAAVSGGSSSFRD